MASKNNLKMHWSQLTGPIIGLRLRLIELFLIALSLQAASLTLPLFTQWMIDSAISVGDRDLVPIIISTFAFAMVFRVCAELASGWMSTVIGAQFSIQWSIRTMRHLIKIPLIWFLHKQVGDIISRFQSMQAIQGVITARITETIVDVFFLLGILAIILAYSAKLSAIALVAAIIYISIRLISFNQLRKYSELQLVSDAAMQTAFIENLQCIQAIKISGIEERRIQNWIHLLLHSTKHGIAIKKFGLGFSSLHGLVQGTETILVLGIGAVAVIDGKLTLGMLIAFIAYKTEFSIRAQRVVDNFVDFLMLRVHVQRLAEISLEKAEEIDGANREYDINASSQSFRCLELQNVGYRHEDGRWILRNLSVTFDAGEHVVVSGPTGCGKSTLAKIILGLISPTEGVIRINGITMEEMGIAKWRSYFSAVVQEDHLFSNTIEANLSYLSPDVDAQRMREAALAAQIHHDIEKMPEKYQTQLQSMGSNISGGQKQRMLIARAIYRNSPIMILDEATSHLDIDTEKKLNIAIQDLPFTVISIAHRLETIKMSSREIKLS